MTSDNNTSNDNHILHTSYENLNSQSFDVIINCIGITNPSDIKKYGNKILPLSKKYDDLIIEYLQKIFFVNILILVLVSFMVIFHNLLMKNYYLIQFQTIFYTMSII